MTRVVYNNNYGGFRLTDATVARFNELSGSELDTYDIMDDIPRHDPILVQAVEECEPQDSTIAIYELKSDRYYIHDYDGAETVKEPRHINWVIVGQVTAPVVT